MFFDELSNDEWALLAVLVSDEPAVRLNRRGRPRAEPRVVANAVLWILTTGEPWSKLPGRYPSGPTCRRRFEEWQLNGTLLEMVRLLSQTGRTFAYIPQPAAPVAAKPAAALAAAPAMRDEGLRGVSWKSPESWQARGAASTPGNWRSADPIADITRQLSGLSHDASAIRARPAPAPVVSSSAAAFVPRPALHANPPVRSGEASAVNMAMEQLDAAIASARGTPVIQDDGRRTPLSMGVAPRSTQVADRHGYLIYAVAEQVPDAMYRASVEIMKGGKRVERSGLIGPRFTDAGDAQQHALEWARQWIDRECAAKSAELPVAPPVVMSSAAAHAVSHSMPAARPLPALRHVPEPVIVSAAPLNGPINAFRGPLRRYPGEPLAASTTALSDAVNAVTESSASDRFSSAYIELISHAG